MLTDLTTKPEFVRYAHMVANNEMARAALDTLYVSKVVSKEAVSAAYLFATAPQKPQTSHQIRSADLVADFMGESSEEADEPYKVRFLTQIEAEADTLYDGDLSIPMNITEARAADSSMTRLYNEAQRIGRKFIHDVYPFKQRSGWIPLGFKNFENWYSDRFPNLAVKDVYRLLREHEVRLRLEPLLETVPNVANLPGKALEAISHLPPEQQQDAAKRAVQIAKDKVIHGAGAKFHNPDKPSTMDTRRAIAEFTGEVVHEPKRPPQKTYEVGEGFLRDTEHAQIALLRVVQAQHLLYEPNTDSVRVNMCEESYRDARFLDLPLLVLIGILESLNYEVKHVDPFAPVADDEAQESEGVSA